MQSEESAFGFLNAVVRGADCARLLTESCGYDLYRMAQRPPLESIQLFAERIKQRGACLSYAATDDNDLGVKSIDERCDRSREVMDRTQPDRCCLALSTKMRFDK